ncbi:MAG TPA: hypothetical protein VIV65_02660 [Gemmatimonadaceae bacterium]|jgi:hypothetical protein
MKAVGLTIVGLLSISALANGQVIPIVPRIDSGPAPHIRPEASQLDPVILTYLATLTPAGGLDSARSLGERSVQLNKSTYAGAPAWEIVETRGTGAIASVDTLITDFTSLAPFHWGASQPLPGSIATSAKLAVEFKGDSMIGVLTAQSGRRTILGSFPSGSYFTAGQIETALRSLPIGAAGWHDSATLVVTDPSRSTVVPAALAVRGEDHLLTMAGTYDCWVVVLSTDVGQTQYWVSKSDRIVVKSSQIVPETGDLLQYTLTRVSHSPVSKTPAKKHKG